MIKAISIPDKQTISIDIPKDYIGKEIEVIAFANDEGMAVSKPIRKNVSFTVLHVDTPDYKFNRDES